MLRARTLAALCSLLALTTSAQTADLAIVRVYHPASPVPSYEVATVKPFDQSLLSRPGAFISKDTALDLIRSAYAFGTNRLPTAQVIGGPSWIDKEEYTIDGKPPAEIALAMQKMTIADRFQLEHALQQSLLADRFRLKVHFEVREMPLYALVPAKGGLKLKQVAAPPPPDPNVRMSSSSNGPLRPGWSNIGAADSKGTLFIRAHAISMDHFINLLSSNLNQTGDRPVADQTGFTGYFDIGDLLWANVEWVNAAVASDAPSLETALEQTLGLRLVLTKGPVEVVVIDSIDHPSKTNKAAYVQVLERARVPVEYVAVDHLDRNPTEN